MSPTNLPPDDTTLPGDFDWPDLPPATEPEPYVHVELASQLQPWDTTWIRRLSGFARQTIRERARLALEDPAGEIEAREPMSGPRARWILLTMAEQEQEDALRRPATPWRPDAPRPDGRELLTRLGADPTRGRGVVRCPAHADRSPSLSWRLADDGRALVHCFSGCSFTEILAAAS